MASMASMSSRVSMANSHKPYFDEEFSKIIISYLNTATKGLFKYSRKDYDNFYINSSELIPFVNQILGKIDLMKLKPKKSSDKPKNSFFKRASKVVKNAVTRKNNKTNKNNNNNNTKKTDIEKFESLCINILLLLKYENDISKDGTNITQTQNDKIVSRMRDYLIELCKFFNNKKFFNFTEKGNTKVISIVYVSLYHIASIEHAERMSALRTSMLPTARLSNARSSNARSSTARSSNARSSTARSSNAMSSNAMSDLNLPSALTSPPIKKQTEPHKYTEANNAALKNKIKQNEKERIIQVEIRTFLDDYIKTNNLNNKSSNDNIDSFSVALNDFLTSKKTVFNSKNDPIKIFDRISNIYFLNTFKYYQLLQLLQKKVKIELDYSKIKQNITEIIKSNPEIYKTN